MPRPAGHGAEKASFLGDSDYYDVRFAFDPQPVARTSASLNISHHERDGSNAANNSYTENRIGISLTSSFPLKLCTRISTAFRQTVSAEPRCALLFNSSGHNRAMAYLRYGLRQGEGFIVITGGIGTGKTMLVSNLFNELHDDNVVAAQLVSTQINEDDVLR